jgi:hypothetical protein
VSQCRWWYRCPDAHLMGSPCTARAPQYARPYSSHFGVTKLQTASRAQEQPQGYVPCAINRPSIPQTLAIAQHNVQSGKANVAELAPVNSPAMRNLTMIAERDPKRPRHKVQRQEQVEGRPCECEGCQKSDCGRRQSAETDPCK